MRKRRIYDEGFRTAINAAGSRYKLAKALGITLPSLTRWKKIPSQRVLQIERLYGIDREKLRPDLHTPRR